MHVCLYSFNLLLEVFIILPSSLCFSTSTKLWPSWIFAKNASFVIKSNTFVICNFLFNCIDKCLACMQNWYTNDYILDTNVCWFCHGTFGNHWFHFNDMLLSLSMTLLMFYDVKFHKPQRQWLFHMCHICLLFPLWSQIMGYFDIICCVEPWEVQSSPKLHDLLVTYIVSICIFCWSTWL